MIVILDFDMGNLGSIRNMFKRLGVNAKISRDHKDIAEADRLLLPGVGAFDRGMEKLHKHNLREILDERVLGDKIPVLGICLGMQLMTKSSDEGASEGLGWIDAATVGIKKGGDAEAQALKLPHIGWNFVDPRKKHPLIEDLPEPMRYYFVHSYRVECANKDDVLLTTDYGPVEIEAAFARGNIAGMQGHPEKSHKYGMKMFTNFAKWTPSGVAGERAYA